ncbi:MAG TPA: hypothetical protein VFY93_17165 [Planctomycetota bacterium]|nr:hypothetical protein [Planctomycetota bacterium]
MIEVLGVALLTAGGALYGFGLARWKRPVVLTAAFGVLIGVTLFFFAPTETEGTWCGRILHDFFSKKARPEELVGAWVGWDTVLATPYCRLELNRDGTGICVLWYWPRDLKVWHVTAWEVWQDEILVSIESGGTRERMRGRLFEDVMTLEYFGSDGQIRRRWQGPLRLIPAATAERAVEDTAAALGAR